MFCRNCGTQLDDRAVACVKCGAQPAAGVSFCGHCGKPATPQAIVCLGCGCGLAPTPVRDPRADTKLAAGICGILLGCFGVHKFILGMTGAGLTMLLVSIIGGLLTCGMATWVIWIIGLVEGIVYLTKSDADFVRDYIEQKKAWF